MMTFADFRRIWESANERTPEQHDLYIAERGWQGWMDEFGEEDTSSIIRVLDAIYTMANGGIAAIRSVTGMSQISFSAAYGIPRRSVENWERDSSETREGSPFFFHIIYYFNPHSAENDSFSMLQLQPFVNEKSHPAEWVALSLHPSGRDDAHL